MEASETRDIREARRYVESVRAKIASAEKAIEERPDSNQARMLHVTLRNLRAELREGEAALTILTRRREAAAAEADRLSALLDAQGVHLAKLREAYAQAPEPEKAAIAEAMRIAESEYGGMERRLRETRPGDDDGGTESLRDALALSDGKIADLERRIGELECALALAEAGGGAHHTDAARILAEENVALKRRIGELEERLSVLAEADRKLSARLEMAGDENAELRGRAASLSEQLASSKKATADLAAGNERLRAYIGRS